MTLSYGTVCSGIGAPEMASLDLGWKCSFMSEIEAFPRAVLKHHYPAYPLHGDFTTIKESDYEPVDVLIGGTPCQDFSVAGKRLGLDAPRGNLALEYLALARRLRAKWLVWENVPGILSSWSDGEESFEGTGRGETRLVGVRQRNDFATFLEYVGECGYGFAWRILDGQHFGVPQRRRRIILVGYLGDWRPATAVLFERDSLRRDLTPRREKGQGVTPILEVGARTNGDGYRDGDGIGQPGDAMYSLQASKVHGVAVPDTAGTLTADTHPGAYSGQDAHSDRLIPVLARCQTPGEGQRRDFETTTMIPVGFSAKDSGADAREELAPTLRAGNHDKSHANSGSWGAVAFTQNSRDEVRAIGGDGQITGALAAETGAKQQTYVAALGHTKSNGLGVDETHLARTLEAVPSSNQAVAFESRFARNGRGAPSDIVPPLKAQSGETGKGAAAPLVVAPVPPPPNFR